MTEQKDDIIENYQDIKINNIADLYHVFAETKFDIKFEQKDNFEKSRVKEIYNNLKQKFYEDHIQLSSMNLFKIIKENEVKLFDSEIDQNNIVKFGFIVNFISGIYPDVSRRHKKFMTSTFN